MKFDQHLYKAYNFPKHVKYRDKFLFPEGLHHTVTFQKNKKLPIYSWFPYKQGFSRDLVQRILDQHADSNSVVYDPFLGSGTTVLASIEKNIVAHGSDLLPLCQFIADTKVQATLINPKEIIEGAKRILNGTMYTHPNWPDVQIINKAIPKQIQDKLMIYRERVNRSRLNKHVKNVLLLALAATIDNCCFAKKDGGFARIVKSRHIRDVDEVFWELCQEFAVDLQIFHSENPNFNSKNVESCKISCNDARHTPAEDKSIDLVITSPPYLNKTDYTRIYSLELCYLFVTQFKELRDLRYKSFCSHVEAKPVLPAVKMPDELQKKILELSQATLTNQRHPQMVEGYFQDLHHCLNDNYRYLKKGGVAAWVVWNARFSGIHFPVDVILAEIAENIGFDIIAIECVRLTGTSAQQAKLYGDKALRESIIYLKKS